MSDQPLLTCDQLVIELSGRRVTSDLSFSATAERVALLGDASALFAALSGRARISSGRFEILGVDAREQVKQGKLGLVTASPVRNPRWTGLDLLTKSARLLGTAGAGAASKAASVLEQLGLQAFATRPLAMLGRAEHVALGIACALLSEPKALAIETPFAHLGDSEQTWLWGLTNLAGRKRRLIVSFDALLLEAHSIIAGFDELIVLRHGQTAQGTPAELLSTNCYLVSVTRGARKLSEALRGAGCQVSPAATSDDGPRQLLVQKDSDRLPRVITEVADQLHVPVIELIALPKALSTSNSAESRAM